MHSCLRKDTRFNRLLIEIPEMEKAQLRKHPWLLRGRVPVIGHEGIFWRKDSFSLMVDIGLLVQLVEEQNTIVLLIKKVGRN